MPLSKNYELGTLANTLDIDQSTGEITSLTIDTDVVSEGANLYFTSERVDDRVAALIQAGTNITVAYDDVLGTLTISASDTEDDLSNNTTSDLAEGTNLYYTNARADARIAAASIDALTDVDITTAAPSNGQSLVWDNANSKFIPGDSFSQSDFDTAFAAKSTTNLSEGTNLYYTDARADARIAAADTDSLSEGSTNLYYTDARADARAQLKIDALVDSAPNTLDTLNELAAALGDDANFSTTITNSIATKLATADFNSTFDTRLGTKSTTNLTEGTNLYYTDARADARIALQAGANLDLSSKSTSDLTEGTNLYYTDARVDAHLNQSNPTSGYVLSWNGSDYAWIDNTGYTAFNTDFDTRLGTKTTADLTEGSNLYYTNARADARVDAGFTAKSTSDLSEGTNLYYTNARADARIALQVGSNLDLSSKDTNSLSEGSNNLYYTNARADARVNLQTGSNLNLSSKDTDDLSEGSNNLYFTNARVQGTAINAGSLRGSVNNATVQYGTSYSGTPAQGSFFFDSLNAKLKVYNGSAFVDAVPASGGGGGGGGASDAVATFRKYTFDISSTTNSVSGKDSIVVTAGNFVTGYQYEIISVGTTDFTAIGASGNTVGVTFTATGVGSGTGTAGHVLNYATSNQNVEVYRNGAKMVEGSSDDYVASTGTSVNFTYNLQSGDVVEVQVYELLTSDNYYLKTETYTQTETNSQISTAVAGYLPLSGGVLTDDLAINNGSPELYFGTTGNHYNWRIAAQEAVDAAFEIAVGSQDTDYSNDTYTPKLVVKSGGSVGIGTNGPESNLHVRSAAVSGKHLDSNTDLLVEGTDTRLQVMASDGGANGSVMLLSTEDHHWIHHAHATSASNMYSLGYYNSSASGFDSANLSSEILNITTAGNVGIGTTSPGYLLDLYGNPGSSAGSLLRLESSITDDNGIIHEQADGTKWFTGQETSNPNDYEFWNYNGSTWSARLHIGTDGNVGIGNNSPGAKLDIAGGSVRMDSGYNVEWGNGYGGGNPAIWAGTASDLSKLRFAPTGNSGGIVMEMTDSTTYITSNVGIGKTSPNTVTNYKTLHINGTVGSLIDMGASNLESRIVADTNGLGFQVTPGSHTYQNIRWKAGQINGATDSHMLLDSNGNVGIGHTDPSYAKLHVRNDTAGGNDNFILMLQNTTTVADSRSGIMFSTNSGQGAGRDGAAIQASNNGVDGRAHITFGNVINNTYEEKVRFTTDGNVSIGAGGAPSERLQIGGNIRAGNTGSTTSFDGGGNDRYIGVSSLSGGDAMFIAHASGYGVGYFGYEPTDDKLIIACDNGGGNNKIDFSLNAGTNANGATDNLTGVHGDPELRISSNAHMVHVRGDTADTGTSGGSKGLSIYTGGGTSCPIYFGSESNSAQKSMYMTGYWIYLRGHQNEGIRFVFSQGAGSAPRSDQYQFKYNSATRPTGNTTWDGFSDSRAKENVQTLTNALDTISQLNPVTFDWTNDYADSMNMFEMDKTDPKSYNWTSVKENGYDLDRKTAQVGFIAQEFETVFPKSITEQELELGDTTIEDFKTVNYDHLIPTLTKAIQELKAENDSLRARLDAAGIE